MKRAILIIALLLAGCGPHQKVREVKYKIVGVRDIGMDVSIMETTVEREDGQRFEWRGNYGLVGETIVRKEKFSD